MVGRQPPPMKILIAEDNVGVGIALQKHLLHKDHEVILVKDGLAAWEVIQNDKPDILLTDLAMPVTSGFELISLIRAQHMELPIVVLSALEKGEELIEEAFRLGADDFLPKPIDTTALEIMLRRHQLKMH